MEINNFNKEFVERTKSIILQTDFATFDYEVTLLINCLTGLVNLPTERTKQEDCSFKDACVNKLKTMGVLVKDSGDKNKTFRSVKNAVSHMHITPQNHNGEVASVTFYDKLPGKAAIHTEMTFNVQQLKEYALFVADEHLNRMI